MAIRKILVGVPDSTPPKHEVFDPADVAKVDTSLLVGERIGVGTDSPRFPIEVVANDAVDDTNYVSISAETDLTRGFSIDKDPTTDDYAWADYVFEDEDGDTKYTASGNSLRDIIVMMSDGRVGINYPTFLINIEIQSIIQTGVNTYATITTEIPHRLANGTVIKIEGATNAKFNGTWTVANTAASTFRIYGVDVGAVTENPTDAVVVQPTAVPAGLAIYNQYFDDIFTFDGGTATFADITANMRTSFGVGDPVLPISAGSYLYIGKLYPWKETCFNIDIASAGSTGISVEYSADGGVWTALTTSTTSGNSLVDGTNRLREDGVVSWDIKSFRHLWKPQTVNGVEQYWIRISLIGVVTIAPVAKAIGASPKDRLAIYSQALDVNPTLVIDQRGRIGFLPAELVAKYQLGTLPGLTTSKFEVVAEDGYRSDFIYYLANSDVNQHPAVVLARSGGTIGAKTAVSSGMNVGGVYGYAYDGAQFREVAGVLLESASAGAAGNVSGRISFWTRPGAAVSAERARITEAGDMGIGTTTPRSKMDVAGGLRVADDSAVASANKVGTLRYRADANNSYVDMCMQTGASTYGWVNIVTRSW
jgi:hypothetical protein